MTDPQRLLVVVDPTVSVHPSVERAAWLARRTGAHLELFISDHASEVDESRTPIGTAAQNRAAVLERHRNRLEQLAEPLRSAGVSVGVDTRWEHPLHDSIVRKSADCRADLVIKDTHFHSVLKRSIFSNTDWSLIRNCAATLWLVKPRPPGQRPCFIAAVDPLHERDKPADLDSRILDVGARLCQPLGGELHVFHAFDVVAAIAVSTDSMTMPIVLPMNELADAMRTRHTEAVERLCHQHGIARQRAHIHQGNTRQLLLALAEQLRADAVVMGAISRSGLKGLFLGNTAEDVLDRLDCDLIIVKPAGFEPVFSS
jgi:universal stress protein E